MATHSSILAWRIPSTEEHGRLQSTESQSGGRNLSTDVESKLDNVFSVSVEFMM